MTASIQGQPHDRTALILYGSETGNSQEAAEQLGRITDRLRFVTQVVEMNHVELVRPFAANIVLSCSSMPFRMIC
jgi:flavodoxin